MEENEYEIQGIDNGGGRSGRFQHYNHDVIDDDTRIVIIRHFCIATAIRTTTKSVLRETKTEKETEKEESHRQGGR